MISFLKVFRLKFLRPVVTS